MLNLQVRKFCFSRYVSMKSLRYCKARKKEKDQPDRPKLVGNGEGFEGGGWMQNAHRYSIGIQREETKEMILLYFH